MFAHGSIATLFFGWWRFYLAELFPARVRAAGSGIACHVGRFATALGVLAAGALFAAMGGSFSSISRRADARNYLAASQPAPLLSVRLDGTLHAPDNAVWDSSANRLTLRYTKAGVMALLWVQAKSTHLTLELLEVQPPGRAELVLWGPYPTTIRQTVGEVVGVVRDGEFALGVQALNPKTLGGFPENDEGSADRPYAARQTAWGSVLQAYSMDRSYKVFFPNLDLQREIARNLARRFNETGLSHMDFDGHEGCLAPGQGTYGSELFAKEFYDHLDHTVINGTSPPLSHFYWPMNR